MTATNLKRKAVSQFELDPKITEQEILDASHDAQEHIGCSKHFGGLLSLLVTLGAFGRNINAPRVADLIYAPSSELQPTPAQDQAGKSATCWGDRRFEKIRYGKASFTCREAEYFHRVFRHVMGEEWSALLTPAELVCNPLQETLLRLRQSSLPGPWSRLNPVQALRILSAAQPATAPVVTIRVERADGLRISTQGDDLAESFRPLCRQPELPAGSEYFVQLSSSPGSEHQFLALEYAEEPMQAEGLSKAIHGQILQYRTEVGDGVRLGGRDDRPLKILDHPGHFGFCVIACPKEWELNSVFDLPQDGLLETQYLQRLVKQIRELGLTSSPVGISLYDYVVPPVS